MNGNDSEHEPLKVAVLQRVCTSYRAQLFCELAADPRIEIRIFIGDDVPNSKVRSGEDLSGLDIVRLKTRFLSLGSRCLVQHSGLIRELQRFDPDVILTEGESNLLSYLKAMVYRMRHPCTALVHWSLGGLPGELMVRKGLRGRLVNALRRNFDAYLLYSSYGKKVMLANGFDETSLFVAVNVSDLSSHRRLAAKVSREQARALLGVGDKFMVLFVGAMTKEKRLDVLIEAAARLDRAQYGVFLVGDGRVRDELAEQILAKDLTHVHLVGRVTEGLENYYRAADVVALPGRGGMVISEAMAYGCPVIAYHADGTEYDLVEDGVTGVRLRKGSAKELLEAIESLHAMPDKTDGMAAEAVCRVGEQFNTENMIANMLAAIFHAHKIRKMSHGYV